jgi:uncharacterized membrane protein YbhN (UPF0104 family)
MTPARLSRVQRDANRRPILTSALHPRWAFPVFVSVPEAAVRRRPSDLVRVLGALVLLVLAAGWAADLSHIEEAVYDFLVGVPGHLDWLFTLLYWSACVLAGALLVAAVATRRVRLALTLGAATGPALLAGVILQAVVTMPDAADLQAAGFEVEGAFPEFPTLGVALGTAGLLAASGYLTRPAQRVALGSVLFAAAAAVVLVEGLPVGVLGGLALGGATAALARFALGSPAATPSVEEIRRSLQDLGVDVTRLALDPDQIWGESRFIATASDDEDLEVAVIGRDATDARLVAKAWRFVWYKDSGPAPALTRRMQVQHRAFVLLLAERAGARVTDLVAAGIAGGRDDALLVTRDPGGCRLGAADPSRVSDDVLDDAWANLVRLHDARLAHNRLGANTVALLDDGTTVLLDLSRTSAPAPVEHLQRDDVGLLAATAVLVGTERALAAAARAVGTEGIESLLPLLQPSVVSRGSSDTRAVDKQALADLRDRAARLVGTDAPEPAELRRVSPGQLVIAAATILGVYLLVGELEQLKDVGDVFADAQWGWVALAFALSQLPQLTSAVAILGSVIDPLPLRPVTAVQFANNFTGLVGGTVATTALVVRFFQKQGRPVAIAVSSGLLNTLAAMITQVVLVAIGLLATGSDFDLARTGGGDDGISGWIIAGVIAVGLGLGVVALVPRLRRQVRARLGPQFRAAKDNLRRIAASPRKAALLFGGNLASQLLFALALDASLHAYGGSLPLLQLVVINSLASVLGGAAPVPGGMGVVEAGLIGGLTAAGVPQATAIATTFTHRLFTSYLPPIWGWCSLQWLRHRDYV